MTRLALLFVTIAACTSNDLSGAWDGTWQSRGGATGSVSASFAQSGDNVGGTMTFTGSPCFDAAEVNEILAGTEVSGSVTAGAIEVDLTGTWTEPDLNGTYDVISAGLCTGDTGTFTLTRR